MRDEHTISQATWSLFCVTLGYGLSIITFPEHFKIYIFVLSVPPSDLRDQGAGTPPTILAEEGRLGVPSGTGVLLRKKTGSSGHRRTGALKLAADESESE